MRPLQFPKKRWKELTGAPKQSSTDCYAQMPKKEGGSSCVPTKKSEQDEPPPKQRFF
ncbi:hypothetical protein Bca4012_018617 [Brassica carinata]